MGMLLLSFLKEWLFHNNILNNTLDFVCSVFGPISCWFSVSGQFPGDSIFFFLKHFPDTISLAMRRNGGEKWYLLQEQSWASATIEKPSMRQECDCTKVWEDLCVVEALG